MDFAVVGYNSRGDHFSNHFGNGFKDIANSISCSKAGQNSCGTNHYEELIKTKESTLISYKKCLNLINTDILMNHNITLILKKLPKCPSGDQVKQDKLFEFDRVRSSGNICYRSKVYYTFANTNSSQPSKFVQQCCYYSE